MSFPPVSTKISCKKMVDLKKVRGITKLGFNLMKKISVQSNLLAQVGSKDKLSLNGLTSQKNYHMC